jgi:hypothetical protein
VVVLILRQGVGRQLKTDPRPEVKASSFARAAAMPAAGTGSWPGATMKVNPAAAP